MRQFKVRYRDNEMSNRDEVFETENSYPRQVAEEVADLMRSLRCHDIEIVEIS